MRQATTSQGIGSGVRPGNNPDDNKAKTRRRFRLPRHYGWVLGWLLLAGGLRFANLGSCSLWIDEVYSLMVANTRRPPFQLDAMTHSAGFYYQQYLAWQPLRWPALVEMLKINVHMPLYYLGLNPWLGWWGNQVVALRSFSACFSTLSLIPLYWLARSLGGKKAGLWTLALACLSPVQIYYAQEGRMYALCLFWAIWASLSFWKVCYSARPGRWGAVYALSAVGGMLTHYVFLFFLGFHCIYALGWLWRSRDFRRFFLLGWAVGALVVMGGWWLPVYQAQQHGMKGEYHFAKGLARWLRYVTTLVWQPWVAVAGHNILMRCFYLPFSIGLFASFLTMPPTLAPMATRSSTGIASVSGFRVSNRYRQTAFLLMWVWLPLGLEVLYDWIRHTHISLIDRYTILISPGMLLCMGLGLHHAWRQPRIRPWLSRLILPLAVCLAIASVWTSSPFRDEHNKDKNIGEKLAYMSQQARPTDLVFMNGPWGVALIAAYYLQQYRPQQPLHYWINRYEGQPVPFPVASMFSPYRRIWLFRYRSNHERGLKAAKTGLFQLYPQVRKEHDWFIYE